MSSKRYAFVDSNVLVYAYDRSELQKQAQALAVLDELARRGAGLLSAQVLAEFFFTITRKLIAPLLPEQAYESLKNYLYAWPVVETTGLIVLEAARGVRDYQLNFWDAQIWATARLNQCQVVLSEDFNTGAVIEGVRFVNPFDIGFALNDYF
jgi:predicted nucleic acid-binding protein